MRRVSRRPTVLAQSRPKRPHGCSLFLGCLGCLCLSQHSLIVIWTSPTTPSPRRLFKVVLAILSSLLFRMHFSFSYQVRHTHIHTHKNPVGIFIRIALTQNRPIWRDLTSSHPRTWSVSPLIWVIFNVFQTDFIIASIKSFCDVFRSIPRWLDFRRFVAYFSTLHLLIVARNAADFGISIFYFASLRNPLTNSHLLSVGCLSSFLSVLHRTC